MTHRSFSARLPALSFAFSLSSLFTACGAQQRPDGGKGYLPVGMQVPDLKSSDQLNRPVELRAEGPTVLYFYPRAGTPGCTKEACAFRDSWKSYSDAGVRVIGVSSDPKRRQADFAKEHDLPFPLISDPDHVWSDAFGVGSFVGFDSRVSFLIDSNAHVAKVYEDVDPGVHADQVLGDVKELGLR
ncbi:MAG: peroxiredoxin [Myxococcales bacterium]